MNAGCEALIKVHPPAPTNPPPPGTKTLILFSVVARVAHPRELKHISALADISPCFEVAGVCVDCSGVGCGNRHFSGSIRPSTSRFYIIS